MFVKNARQVLESSVELFLNFNGINIMQIRAFCQVVKWGSVSRAANDLFRTQSAVTRAIRDLEQSLEVTLFERHFSGMILTDYGRAILPRARRAIEELQAIPAILERLKPAASPGREYVEPVWLFNARRLQIFLMLWSVNHTQSVARLLNITQPAVSAALKMLEKGSGFTLFRRTPEGVMPTPAAQAIYPGISRALNELRLIAADISARRGILEGDVRIGALPLSRTRLLPGAVSQFLRDYPTIRVMTNESPFDALVSEMRAGNIDFIIGALRDCEGTDLSVEPLFEEEMLVLARVGHPLQHQPVTPEALARARWVLPRAMTPARQLLETAFREMGLPAPQPRVETGDLAMVRGLLLDSDMLAAVSASQLAVEIESGVLAPLPLKLSGTRRAIGLTFRTGALPSPAAAALLEAIRQVAHSQ
jgi:LysR family transcriptional regulator of gallate degradation